VTASELARDLPITRQAVAKHLATLADAGLVTSQRSGRETRYRLTPAPLTDARRQSSERHNGPTSKASVRRRTTAYRLRS